MTSFCFESSNWSSYFGCAHSDVSVLIEAGRAAGFEWISFDHALLEAARDQFGSTDELAKCVSNAGLRTLALHAVAITEDEAATLEAAAPLLEAGPRLGAPYLHCGVVAPLGDALFACTRALAQRARAAGMAIALEFLPFLPVASIDDTRAVVRACQDAGAGLVVDTWHFFHGPDGWPELASLEPDEIAYIQFNDHPPLESKDLLRETTERRVIPGTGTFELERFARTLLDRGFDGIVGLEHLSQESRARPPAEVAGELIKASARYWK